MFASSPASAQPDPSSPSLVVLAGASQYDLSGTGWGAFLAGRASFPWIGPVVLEPGIEVFSYESQFVDRHSLLMPGVQLQLARREGRVRPYGGIGGGVMIDFSESGTHGDWTLSASTGTRFALSQGMDLIGELRLRSLAPWKGTMADLGVGLGWDF
ncbi:MAG: hypothetical protein ACREMK_14650 [Gemmatimonadota bacterium]